jgi:hypothetical protein
VVAAARALTIIMYILFILILVCTVVVVSTASLVLARNPPAPDPRVAILAQYEAGLIAYIRERYNCTDEATRQVRRGFLEWEMDAADTGVAIGEDGEISLSNDAVDLIDCYALKLGLSPAAKTERHV